MLVIDNLHAVDSQTQATFPATLGTLTPPMVIEGDHITVPNGVPGASNADAQFKFRCSQAVPALLLAFEVRAPNGNDDSFRIAMDAGDHIDWHIPRAGTHVNGATTACVDQHCDTDDGFHWATYQGTFDISLGKHTLHIFGREDGTQMRNVRFADAPGCRWTPKLPASVPQVSAVFGKLTAPMVMKDDFVWVAPCPSCECHNHRGAPCPAKAEFHFSCRSDATVAFDFEILTPNGSDDSFFISIDEDQVFEWQTQHHQTFSWEARSETTDVDGGLHKLVVHTREDGTKLRAIRFSAGGCGFIPATNRLPSVEPASFGVLAGTFTAVEDYVVTSGLVDWSHTEPTDAHCLLPQPTSDHTQWFGLTAAQQAGATQVGWTVESWTCFKFNSQQGGISISQSNDQWTTANCDVPVSTLHHNLFCMDFPERLLVNSASLVGRMVGDDAR